MRRLSAINVVRHFSAVLDAVERDQQEIVVVRNRRQIPRLIPEGSKQDALEVFRDLYRMTHDQTGKALSEAIAVLRRGRVNELRRRARGPR